MDVLERLLGVLRRLSIVGVWVLGFLFAFYSVNNEAWHMYDNWRQFTFLLASLAIIVSGIGLVNWIFTGHHDLNKLKKRKSTEDPE